MPTRAPNTCSAAAKLVVTVDFPTPPLPEDTAMMFFTPGMAPPVVSEGRAVTLAVKLTDALWMPGTVSAAAFTSASIWALWGQAGGVGSVAIAAAPPSQG